MLRWLFIQLIWLHPAPFRWQFGDEMLDDFDRVPPRLKCRYLADAVVSLARQWLLRPEFRHPETSFAEDALLRAAAIPRFQTIEPYQPRPSALAQGGLLAILSILTAVLLIDKAGGARPFLIGVHFSRPSLFHVDRNSLTAADPTTTVKVGADPFEAWLKLARPYFAAITVLRALDADRDLTLSPREIASAPAVLRSLDLNHNGDLTAEACGLYLAPDAISLAREQLRRRFMTFHPILAALDANHDGKISAREIDRAAALLKTLDRNRDGYLTPDELIPFEWAVHAGLR